MNAGRQPLQPPERARRRAALERYATNSARLPVAGGSAPDMAMAGATSAPVAQGNSDLTNSPAPCGCSPHEAPAFFWPKRSFQVSYEHARRYALRHGLTGRRSAVDLRRVNDFRQARGLAPLALRGEG